jgi:hypothetical protein
MSLFLGNDISYNKVLHITQGQNTSSEMKSGVLSNTVFHSDLPYIKIKKYSATKVLPQVGNALAAAEIDSTLAGELDASGQMYFFVVDGRFYDKFFAHDYYAWLNPQTYAFGVWSSSGSSSYSISPTAVKNTYNFGEDFTTVDFYTVNMYNGLVTSPSDGSSDIRLNGDDLVINGVDLADFTYMSENQINQVDDIVDVSGTDIQFVGNNIVGTGMEIKSNSLKSEVKKSGVPLFTTDSLGYLQFLGERETLSVPALINNLGDNYFSKTISSYGDYLLISIYYTGSGGILPSDLNKVRTFRIVSSTNLPETPISSYYYSPYNGAAVQSSIYITVLNGVVTVRVYNRGAGFSVNSPAFDVNIHVLR